MVPRRLARGWLGVFVVVLHAGCGDTAEGVKPVVPPSQAPSAAPKTVRFVGFDASAPLVQALEQGKLQGIVVQNPYRMGELGVRTLVDHLEKKEVPPQISTGEKLVTPENMKDPEVDALIHPPKAENRAEASLSGSKTKKWRI